MNFTGRSQSKLPKQMRSYDDSMKSKKTVASMIERKGGEKQAPQPKKSVKIFEEKPEQEIQSNNLSQNDMLNEDVLIANRRKLAEKLSGKKKSADSK